MNRQYDERGAAPGLEALILVPVVLVIIAFIVIAAQVAMARDAVTNASSAAARAATQERTSESAGQVAQDIATSTLQGSSLQCIDHSVTTDTSGFAVPVGQPARVSVTVTCTAARSYLGILNGGSKTFQATSSAPLDQYRGR